MSAILSNTVQPPQLDPLELRPLQEQYESLVRQLLAPPQGEERPLQAVGITAATDQQGVSTVAANLAATVARFCDEKVILVDGNFSQPSVATTFRLNRPAGLSDVLAGKVPVGECLYCTSVDNLFVLPAGIDDRHTAFKTKDATALLEALRAVARFLVVDLPSVQRLGSALALAATLDGLLLVVEAEGASRFVTRRAVDQLHRGGARLLGTVFNKRREHIPQWLYRQL